MAQSNHEQVGHALELLNTGLRPFIEREMQAAYGSRWLQEAVVNLREYQMSSPRTGQPNWDTQVILQVMWDQWNSVFKSILGHAERSLISELRETRNKWAHQGIFTSDDAYRALDSIYRLLTAVSASQQANEIDQQRQELLRIRFDEQEHNLIRNISLASVESEPLRGLRPWREVVTPQPDVASGRYQLADFAADLGQVHRGNGPDEYRMPRDFFQRTYLTNGLHRLLVGALRRLSGTGGDPIIDLQTSFGGGKTHSLLALYHLFSGAPASEMPGIESILAEAAATHPPQAQRAVLVGYELSPALPQNKPDGCIVHTLWGELAWQLLGADGYAMVAEADRRGISPGSEVLRELFICAAPCLILIDEWVVYVRQTYNVSGLPGGSFDANLSFAQSLTEAAKVAPQTLIVATIPASNSETGGEGGKEAAIRLKNIFRRVESPWRPADTEEGFEIVRRRLFQPIPHSPHFAARDTVAKAFLDLYRSSPQDFPAECRESDYEKRIRDAYPIHPELFDRLYNDWSSIEKFQRTRGVLRLMATVIHALWESADRGLLIMPASVPVGTPAVQREIMLYLEDHWNPVIEKDVDGSHSLPTRLDGDHTTLGRYSACRRVTHTIFLGSAPNPRVPNKGLTESYIKLGCVQPGENTATFGDALRRLSDQSTHLYMDGQRYWYTTQPSVSRLAQDRAAQLDEDKVYEELEKRLRGEKDIQSDFAKVYVCPAPDSDVVEEDTAIRLVILKPSLAHATHDLQSAAREEAKHILDYRGNARRGYRNTLVFLAADRNRVDELKQGVRSYLAWDSIHMESETLNLDAFQRNQARTKRDEANKSVEVRIPEAYIWLLVPDQPDPQQSDDLQEFRLQPQSQLSLTHNVNRRLKTEEMLVTHYAGILLRTEMDRIPLWQGNHVSIKYLVDYFAKYVYLPRLKNTEVLLAAISDGVQLDSWQIETFAYASSWDAPSNRYLGLRTGPSTALLRLDVSSGVLVKPEVATSQIAADVVKMTSIANKATLVTATSEVPSQQRSNVLEQNGTSTLKATDPQTVIPSHLLSTSSESEKAEYHHFYGSTKINPQIMADDAEKVMEEIVKHLTSLENASVIVTLEIQAMFPGGVSTNTVQIVSENCRTLRFDQFEFNREE